VIRDPVCGMEINSADVEILSTSEAGAIEAPSAPILAEPTVVRAARPPLPQADTQPEYRRATCPLN
jgi:hypothetical protein